ncbi:VOC family protein [Segnochrobactrum spirostomi]|nr:VOC family protein [Segnochrobactrum spirostomi]
MPVIRLQSAYLVVDDMAESRAFYEDILGLKLKFADAARWTQYDCGGASFALGDRSEGPEEARGATIVFEVQDLEAMTTRLRDAGTALGPLRDMGAHGRVLTVADPAGNLFQLFERATPAKAG